MSPIVAPGRIVGLDVARAVALVGMMATHMLPAVTLEGVSFVQQLAGGRSAALFALLAGVSIALMTGRTTPLTGPEREAVVGGLVVRALVVAVIGLFLGALGSGIAVILTNYGLLFLLAIPFSRLRATSLAVLSGIWLVVVPVLSHLLRPHLPEPTFASPTFESLTDPWRLLTDLTFTGYYPVVPWLAYLLAGMAIGRLDLARVRVALTLLASGALLAVAGWFLSDALLSVGGVAETLQETYDGRRDGPLDEVLTHGLFGTTPTGSWWWLAVRAPHSGTPFDLAHTIGTAMVVIGLCLVVSRLAPRVFAVVFGAGAMSLTVYTAHVMMRSPEVWPDDADGLSTFLTHVLLLGAVGAVFRLFGQPGPLEQLTTAASKLAADSVRRTPV